MTCLLLVANKTKIKYINFKSLLINNITGNSSVFYFYFFLNKTIEAEFMKET